MSLVLILRVFCVRRVYRGSIFFSLVLILRICAYLGIKGDWFFSDLWFFLALFWHTNWCTTICITCPILRKIVRFLHKIECIKFVCNKFVLVLVQIDLIQFCGVWPFWWCGCVLCVDVYYQQCFFLVVDGIGAFPKLPEKMGHKKKLNTKVQSSKSSLFSSQVRCQECMGST